MKRLLVFLCFVVVAVVLVLALPVSNLIVGAPVSEKLTSVKSDDGLYVQVAHILGTKCANCHTADYQLPFYAQFPVAKDMIRKDIEEGTRYLDMPETLVLADGAVVNEAVMAKLEFTTERNTMPPFRYLALHWDGGLTADEQQAILDWVRKVRRENYATAGQPENAQNNVLQPVPQSVEVDARKVALGNKLFHDVRLSKDNSLSCASCHGLDMGGTDQAKSSTGVGGAIGPINSPTVYNAGLQFAQFWDGRAANLQEQADGPVNNPIEMASNWDEVIPKLEQDVSFAAEFKAVYPEGFSKDTITNAIATFEETLLTPNSRFDKFLAGDASALTDEEKAGHDLFIEKACATCHVGSLLGGKSYEYMGRKADYFADRGEITDADNGRFAVTQDERDRHKFKVPTLRNLTVTFPYFHDGSTSDIAEAVKTMAKYNQGITLTDQEANQITLFLQTLSGEYQGKPL